MCSCGTSELTLEQTGEKCWIQRASFTHADLHDELVSDLVALSSPFAGCGDESETVCYTFLLLGDQNAGKSTFLHAFTNAGDASWLALASFLPIVSSSFLNASLLASPAAPPMDEPPFIDTDVGRATMLLTLEDFAFFCSEFELPIATEELARLARGSEARPAVRYAQISLIEIGGDHLDRMMASAGAAAPATVLQRSEQLVRASMRSLYFVNASALLRVERGAEVADHGRRLVLIPEQVLRLVERLSYLSQLFADGADGEAAAVEAEARRPRQPVVLCLSRVPPPGAGLFTAESAARAVASLSALHTASGVAPPNLQQVLRGAQRRVEAAAAAAREEEARPAEEAPPLRLHAAPPPHAALLCGFLPELLGELLCARGTPHVSLCEAFVAEHVPPAGQRSGGRRGAGEEAGPALHADGVVATLARLFDRSLHRTPRLAAHAALLCGTEHLLRCFKQTALRLRDADGETTIELWLTPALWEAYLEAAHDSLEMPSNALLRSFEPLAAALARACLAITHFDQGHANVRLACTFAPAIGEHGRFHWPLAPPPAVPAGASQTTAIRFPYFAPLFAVIDRQLARGLPADWWLEVAEADKQLGVSALDEAALAEAEVLLRQQLQAQLLRLCAAELVSWQVFVYLVEDWCLCVALQRSRERQAGGVVELARPVELALEAPEAHWRNEVQPFLGPGDAIDCGSWALEPEPEGVWRVSLLVSACEESHCLECRH